MADNKNETGSSGQSRSDQRAVPVFTAHDELEADLIKEFLHGCGIESVVQGRLASGVYPGFIGDLGKREILVLEDDVEDAKELLAGWNDNTARAEEEVN